MKYSVSLTRRAQRQLESISEPHRARLRAAITDLSDNPRPANCLKMSGSIYLALAYRRLSRNLRNS